MGLYAAVLPGLVRILRTDALNDLVYGENAIPICKDLLDSFPARDRPLLCSHKATPDIVFLTREVQDSPNPLILTQCLSESYEICGRSVKSELG